MRCAVNYSLIISLMWLAACASLRSSEDPLSRVVEDFHHDLRWKYNDNAVSRVDPKFSADLLDELDAAKDLLFITGYEVRHVEPDAANKLIKVKVLFSYYRLPSTVVKEELALQVWKKTGERWFLVSQEGGPFTIPPAKRDKPPPNDEPHEKESQDGSPPE